MAFTIKTVGTLGSGADFAASVGALQDWEDNYDSIGLEQRASLITDIVDDVLLQTWPSGSVIEIVSSEEGAQRKITQQSSGGHGIQIDDEDLTDVTINDIYFECENQASSKHAVYVSLGGDTLELNRVRLSNCTSDGLNLAAGSSVTTATLNNCIADDNGGVGFNSLATSCTLTYSNCGSYSNTSHGFGSANDATAISILQNCIAMDNSGEDFRDEATGVTRLYNCVSEDATANDANHDVKDGVAYSQSSTGVFLDLAGGNFSRTKSDTDAFSITGNASLTPARDYYFIERANDTIGPFDLILGRQTHRISKLFNGTDGFVDVGDISASIKGISFWCRPSVVESHTDSLLSLNSSDTITLVNDQVTVSGFSGGSVTRYVDGVAGSTLVANVWQHVFVDSDTGFSASNVHIGRAGSVYFGGYLRDVRLYTTTVSAGDIASLADPDKTCSTALETAGHWKLESSHPVRAYDSSGNANHGGMAAADVTNDLESPVPFSFANEVGYSSSLFFDGTADFMTFPAAIKTGLSTTGDFTFFFDCIVGATEGIMFGTRNGANTDKFALGNASRCTVYDSAGYVSANVAFGIPVGSRDRFAVTWDSDARSLGIWRNGASATHAFDANAPEVNGTWAMSSQGTGLFNSGEINQITIWQTAISDSDADALSTDGTFPSETPFANFAFNDGVGAIVSDSAGSAHGSAISSPIWVVIPRDESDATKDVRGDLLDFSGSVTGGVTEGGLSGAVGRSVAQSVAHDPADNNLE